MTYTVKQKGDGWVVCSDGKEIMKCESNQQAWRQCDILNGDPHNAKEARHDWAFRQEANQ